MREAFVVGLIVLGACGWLGVMAYRKLVRPGRGGCGGCSGCPAAARDQRLPLQVPAPPKREPG